MDNKDINYLVMYNVINFPEGTNYRITQYNPYDIFSDDYPITHFSTVFLGDDYAAYPIIAEQKKLSQCMEYDIDIAQKNSYCYLPTLDLTNISTTSVKFRLSSVGYGVFVFDGSPNVNAKTNTGTIEGLGYYNYNQPQLIEFLRKNIKIPLVPYGDVDVSVRILRNGEWMDGQPANFNHTPMTYIGGGVYTATIHQEPRERYNYAVDDGEYGASVELTTNSFTVLFGGNSSVASIFTGENMDEIITDNSSGWYYDETIDGFRNNNINGVANGTTTLKLSVPSSEISLTYGQDSESNYDYCVIKNGNGDIIADLKGIKTDSKTITLNSSDGVFIFTYKKDGSGDNGKDAFWIKQIMYTEFPPYPEN